MIKDLFIGGDGGGTKTKIEIEDAEGNLIGRGKGGPANIRTSVDTAWTSVMDGIHAALAEANIRLDDPNYRFHLGLGLAGTEVPAAKKNFLSRPHPFTTLMVESDAYIACLGVHGGKNGAIIIIGTGSIGYQIENQKVVRVGGFGFPHDDLGGGAWLGLEACRLTFQSLDGRISETPLLKAVFEHFDDNLQKFTIWANQATPGNFGELAPLVFLNAQAGDPYAIDLLQQAAQYINRIWFALKKKSHSNLNCGLLGGIAPLITHELCDDLQARLVPRRFDAAKGAILMLHQYLAG